MAGKEYLVTQASHQEWIDLHSKKVEVDMICTLGSDLDNESGANHPDTLSNGDANSLI